MRALSLVVVITSSLALAQEGADAGAPLPLPAGVEAPAASSPDAGVLLAPPPAPVPGSPSVLQQVLDAFRPYGTIKPTVMPSSAAVESFSQPNASAITAAGNPVLANSPDHARLTFQVAQSRLGLWVNEKGRVRGHVEIDFIDFSKASPTVASLPRLRIAALEWQPLDALTLAAGQDWDLHAPLNAHGSNMVGTNFLSGNTGFMRQQVKVLGKLGDFELGGAVGMEGVNATAKDAAFELSDVPTFALRVQYGLGAHGKVGVSGLATSLILGLGTPTERRTFAGAAAVFADLTFAKTNVRFEANLGRNESNIGMLGLGFGGAKDLDEWGGFVSIRQGLTEMHALYAHAGLARVLNRSDVKPSYGYATLPADGSPPPMSSAALTTTGPGMMSNVGVTLGYELRVHKNLAFLFEGFYFHSEHVLQAVDAARVSGDREAFGGELAGLLTF